MPADARDCGHVIDTPAGLQALARCTPRRATLLVAADHMPKNTLHSAVGRLRSLAPISRQPVRLLVLATLPADRSAAVRLIDVDRSL